MQLATSLEQAQLWLDLHWVPREDNVLADALTNCDFTAFSMNNRVEAQISPVTFPTMFEMLAEARALYDTLEASKARAKGPRQWPRTAKHKKLKAADPW